MDWVYHVIHGRVVSHEVDHLVWVIFGGFHVWGESTTRTLFKKRKRSKPQFQLFAFYTLFQICSAYSSRSWVGDLPGVCHPLIVGALLVSKGAVEDHTDVSHGVDAHRRAFKHSSVQKTENKLNPKASTPRNVLIKTIAPGRTGAIVGPRTRPAAFEEPIKTRKHTLGQSRAV